MDSDLCLVGEMRRRTDRVKGEMADQEKSDSERRMMGRLEGRIEKKADSRKAEVCPGVSFKICSHTPH